jgi:hypothetical protein
VEGISSLQRDTRNVSTPANGDPETVMLRSLRAERLATFVLATGVDGETCGSARATRRLPFTASPFRASPFVIRAALLRSRYRLNAVAEERSSTTTQSHVFVERARRRDHREANRA